MDFSFVIPLRTIGVAATRMTVSMSATSGSWIAAVPDCHGLLLHTLQHKRHDGNDARHNRVFTILALQVRQRGTPPEPPPETSARTDSRSPCSQPRSRSDSCRSSRRVSVPRGVRPFPAPALHAPQRETPHEPPDEPQTLYPNRRRRRASCRSSRRVSRASRRASLSGSRPSSAAARNAARTA